MTWRTMSAGPNREVLGANAARVDSREDGNELLDVALLLPRRVLGELRGERVQEQPGAAAQVLARHPAAPGALVHEDKCGGI